MQKKLPQSLTNWLSKIATAVSLIIHHKDSILVMMESDERLSMYFDDALSKISEARVMENFMNSLNDLKPRVNGLELLKYTCYDWRSVFCANEKRLLKRDS